MGSKFLVQLVFLLLAFSATTASSHVGCLNDSVGNPICAPPNGGIMMTNTGRIVCGYGQCMESSSGVIVCSSQRGGFVTKDLLSRVVCTGGCVEGSASLCQVPR
jgi:hypothetical protein